MKVYHGSDHKIEKFSDEFVGNGIDRDGPGIYVTSKKEYAQYFGEYVYEMDFDVDNAHMISRDKKPLRKHVYDLILMAEEWQDKAMNWDINPKRGVNLFVEQMEAIDNSEAESFEQIWYDFYRYQPIQYLRNMVKLGYDYVPAKDQGDHIFIILNPALLNITNVLKESKKMCQGKKSCSCGCSVKKKITENEIANKEYDITKSKDYIAIKGIGFFYEIEKHMDGHITFTVNEDKSMDAVSPISLLVFMGNESKGYFGTSKPKDIFFSHSVMTAFRETFLNGSDLVEAVDKLKDKTLLLETRVNLKLTSNNKRELIKKAKTALDSIYSIYDICEKLGIDSKAFIKHLDKSFTGTNDMLNILVTQDTIEKK